MYSSLLTQKYLRQYPQAVHGIITHSENMLVVISVSEKSADCFKFTRQVRVDSKTTISELINQLELPVVVTKIPDGFKVTQTPNNRLRAQDLHGDEIEFLLKNLTFLHNNGSLLTGIKLFHGNNDRTRTRINPNKDTP